MRRLLAIVPVAAASAAAVLFAGASDGQRTEKTYDIVFDNAFGLVAGGDLRIGGVKAGETTGFRLSRDEPPKVIVESKVTKPGFASLRTDATCAVRQQSLIGEYFVDCDLGEASEELPNGGTVPVERTASTIPPDLIQNVMRRPYRERFRLILSELGAGLAGRPGELNEVIRRAHPALRETSETFKILADQNKVIAEFIRNADRVSAAVEPRKEEVARWAEEASQTASIQASRREELAAYWHRLPDFLRELEPTMAQLEQTADRQIPALRKLQAAAPDLEDFLSELGPFAEASQGSISALGRASETGRAALIESREEIAQLRELSADAPRLGKPLRQFLQTIDDRSRSIEDDPLAAETSPPPPDKTAYQKGQGFTGMEALWNYFYWQTQAINAVDSFGHVLRLVAFRNSCSPYFANPPERIRQECASWLGPTQPGVTTPDATEGGLAEREARERRRAAAGRGGRVERRGAGEPEAPPIPGQPDLSKPQYALPPGLQDLLDRLPGLLDDPPKVPDQGSGAPSELLDFLLAP